MHRKVAENLSFQKSWTYKSGEDVSHVLVSRADYPASGPVARRGLSATFDNLLRFLFFMKTDLLGRSFFL
jgi:hypothetical protein